MFFQHRNTKVTINYNHPKMIALVTCSRCPDWECKVLIGNPEHIAKRHMRNEHNIDI